MWCLYIRRECVSIHKRRSLNEIKALSVLFKTIIYNIQENVSETFLRATKFLTSEIEINVVLLFEIIIFFTFSPMDPINHMQRKQLEKPAVSF